jgi:hypothetical protein
MKNPYLWGLLRIACGMCALAAVLTVAIYKTQLVATNPDKLYPALLGASFVFLHWLAWRIYFELIGLPDIDRVAVEKNKISHRSGWRLAIGFGYFFLILSLINHYTSPAHAHAATGVGYAIILVLAGLIGQMAYVTRHLITQKYKGT